MLQCCDHPVTEKINGDPKDYSKIKMVPQYFISIKKKIEMIMRKELVTLVFSWFTTVEFLKVKYNERIVNKQIAYNWMWVGNLVMSLLTIQIKFWNQENVF